MNSKLKKALLVGVGGAVAVAGAITNAGYFSVGTDGNIVVDPSLQTDLTTQIKTGVVESTNLVLGLFVSLIAILMVVAAVYYIRRWISRKFG